MSARITIIGGGSYHWAPRLLSDFANTPSLEDAEVVLHDLDMSKVAQMVEYGEKIAALRDIKLAVRGEGDRKRALHGAEFVVSAFSVGGFESMRHDLEIPAKYGIRQPIGDSIGPGGVMRALRSIPAVLGFARDTAEVAPDALFLNVSNPLSALTRTITRETGLRAVGLCNELIGCAFVLSLLTDAPMFEIDPTVAGVNHFPMIVALRMSGEDGFAKLRDVLDNLDERGEEPIWMTPPEGMHWTKRSPGEQWTKADVAANLPVKLELFRRFGVLPGAHDHHVVEFMPGFVNEQNDFGVNWNIHHYGLSGHMEDADDDLRDFEERMRADEVTRFPSGELVANLIDGVVTGTPRALPMNLPNAGQCPDLPNGVVVEAMGIADADGVRPRDIAPLGGILGEYVRRTVVAQELTVDAGLLGDRTLAFEAMLADPVAGRLPYEAVAALTGEMLEALEPWLPQFA